MRIGLVWWGVAACTAPDSGDAGPDDSSAPSPSTPDTGEPATTDAPPPSAEGACAVTDHPLVFQCDFALTAEAPLTLTLTAPGATDRTFDSASALEHHLVAWGLQPETTYIWSAGDETGTLTTGGLPAALATLPVEVEGELFGIDAVLVHVGCGFLAMIEGDGDIVWFTASDVFEGRPDGMMWSQDDRTVIAASDSVMTGGASSVLEEVDLLGNTVLELSAGGDFDLLPTHDVGRWGAYTYVLAENGSQIGGFEVFEGTTRLGTWLLTDDFPSVARSHVNGLTVSATGQVVVSELNYDAVVAIDGDPTSGTFLQRLWHASGRADAAFPDPDFAPTSGVIFDGQHNASRHGSELWVFDNRSQSQSRALRMAMDAATGELTELDSWSMGRTCTNQGGAMPIDGGVLATCANAEEVRAYRDSASTPAWTLQAGCADVGLTRGFPVLVR